MRRPLTEAQREARRQWMHQAWASGRFVARKKGMHPRHWTAEQNDALGQLIGTMPIEQVAEALNRRFKTDRTVTAVHLQVKRLGLSRWVQFLSMRDLERIFGCDHRVIAKHWIAPGHLVAKRWSGRGPNDGWWIERSDVERFVDEFGWLYDVARMKAGHPLTRRAQLVAMRDPWRTYQELAAYLGIRGEVNLDRWRRRGLVPHRRRPKSGPGMQIVIRGRDFPAIKAAVDAARSEAIAARRQQFTERQQARTAASMARVEALGLGFSGACRNGHARTAVSTLVQASGKRQCRSCREERRASKERAPVIRFIPRADAQRRLAASGQLALEA